MAGRTLDVPVACAESPTADDPDPIPINRYGGASNSNTTSSSGRFDRDRQRVKFQETLSPRRSSWGAAYRVPVTPRHGDSRNRSCNVGSLQASKAKVTGISLASPRRQQGTQIEVRQDSKKVIAGIRDISVDPGSEAPAEDAHTASLRPAETSFLDFSLFLIKNARAREEIRGSLKRGLEKKEAAGHGEELEALLRKWEAAQLEEEAAARAQEETLQASAVVQPMFPSLKELPLLSFINAEGKIEPQCEPDTASSVFAVFDRFKKVQYIGISKNIKSTLRKLMGRKPGYCYFYKLYNLPHVEEGMLQSHLLRQRWIEELGAPPPGNSDQVQQKEWEQPLDARGLGGAEGPLEAAVTKVKRLIQSMVDRGLKEEMVYDPALMELGRCDVLEATTPAEAPKGKHTVVRTPKGGSVEYYICYHDKIKTKTGWKFDVSLNKDNDETRHVVTCDLGSCLPEGFLELSMAFLLHKGIPRSKEWRSGFSMSNFSLAELMHKFHDFETWLPRS